MDGKDNNFRRRLSEQSYHLVTQRKVGGDNADRRSQETPAAPQPMPCGFPIPPRSSFCDDD